MARISKNKKADTSKATKKISKKDIIVDDTAIVEQVIKPVEEIKDIQPKTSKKLDVKVEKEIKKEIKEPVIKKFKAQNLSDFLY